MYSSKLFILNLNFTMKRNEDLMWSLSLYGTAIGAGVLFLPIQTGISGIIPILVILVFIFPIVFL